MPLPLTGTATPLVLQGYQDLGIFPVHASMDSLAQLRMGFELKYPKNATSSEYLRCTALCFASVREPCATNPIISLHKFALRCGMEESSQGSVHHGTSVQLQVCMPCTNHLPGTQEGTYLIT